MRLKMMLLSVGCCLPVFADEASEIVSGMTNYLSGVLMQQSEAEYAAAPSLGVAMQRSAGILGAEMNRRGLLAAEMPSQILYSLSIPPSNQLDPPPALPDNSPATVDASALLNATNISPNESPNIQRLVRNLSIPQPGFVTPPDTSSPQAAIKSNLQNAEAFTKESALSVAQYSWMNMYAMRQPTQTMPNSQTQVSLMDLMEAEATGRYTDPTWYKNTALASPEAVTRELLYMEAFRNWMLYEQYRQGERIEALLATLVTSQADIGAMTRNMQNQMNSVPNVAPNLNNIRL